MVGPRGSWQSRNMRTCEIDGCEGKHYGNGYCRKHYDRVRRHGSPDVRLKIGNGPALERFLEQTVLDPEHGLVWIGSKTNTGYGRLKVDGRLVYAHRYSYATFVGWIPEGYEIDHLCGRTDCVDPDHLQVVTGYENLRRRHENAKNAA
jgi:hypothetical protein